MEAYKQEFIDFMVESDVLKFGVFTNSKEMQTVEFAPRSARYVKLLALSAVDGGKQATVAELEILVVD